MPGVRPVFSHDGGRRIAFKMDAKVLNLGDETDILETRPSG